MHETILLSDWLLASGCPRSTAYELFKLAGIEPGKTRVPGSRRPVSELSAEQREQMDWLWGQRKAGTSREAIQRLIAQAQGQRLDDLEPSADSPQTTPEAMEPIAAIEAAAARGGVLVPAIEASVERITIKAVAVALQSAKPPRPPVDPLKAAKVLAEAAQLDWLSRSEIARVLGLSQTALNDLNWPHMPRPGYRVEREEFSGEPWFRVVRLGSAAAVGSQAEGGFIGMARELSMEIIPARVVELPHLPFA